jgi:hypothetical protein
MTNPAVEPLKDLLCAKCRLSLLFEPGRHFFQRHGFQIDHTILLSFAIKNRLSRESAGHSVSIPPLLPMGPGSEKGSGRNCGMTL